MHIPEGIVTFGGMIIGSMAADAIKRITPIQNCIAQLSDQLDNWYRAYPSLEKKASYLPSIGAIALTTLFFHSAYCAAPNLLIRPRWIPFVEGIIFGAHTAILTSLAGEFDENPTKHTLAERIKYYIPEQFNLIKSFIKENPLQAATHFLLIDLICVRNMNAIATRTVSVLFYTSIPVMLHMAQKPFSYELSGDTLFPDFI